MARDTYAEFQKLLDRQYPQFAQAFAEAVADIKSVAQIRAIERAIADNDVAGVIRAMALDDRFWRGMDEQLRAAFTAGALYNEGLIPASAGVGPVQFRFDGRHARAENWVRNRSSNLIVEIGRIQREAVRVVVREGLASGDGPRTIARALIGIPEGNGRVGGIIGLTSTQASYVQAARRQLETLDSAYFRKGRRDARFDRTVRKAIRDGKPLTAAQIDRITARYADRLLQLRGETVARTESISALNAGRYEGYQQMIEEGVVPASAVKLVWQATPGVRTRDTHRAMNKQTKRWGEAFQSPRGALLRHPGDSSLGAPAREVVNCRCSVRAVLDFKAIARARGTL